MKFENDDIKKLCIKLSKTIYEGHHKEAAAKDGIERYFEKNDKSSLRLLLDPITWAFIGTKLAEGAIAWIGGKIVETIFSEAMAQGDEKDWETIIRFSIIELKTAFKGIIDANELNKAIADVNALQKNMREYNNAPKSSFDRLSYATVQCVSLVENLKRFGIDGLGGYVIAQGIHFLIIQERFKSSKDVDELKNITDLKKDVYLREIGDFVESAKARNRSFFSPINDNFGVFFCRFNDQIIPLGDSIDEAKRNYGTVIFNNFKQVFENDIQKALEIVNMWFKIEPTDISQKLDIR